MTTARINLPPKLVPVFAAPRGSVDYRALFGGRGSGKSFNAAKMAAIWGYIEPLRILCTREFQSSISESFHAELRAAIASEPWLEAAYDVGVDYLRGKNGTQFIFRGLRRNSQSIKSLAKIDLTIVEEAEDVPEESWLALEATVFRQPRSELWPIWNPRDKESPVDKRFRGSPPARAIVAEVNWSDNPFFPKGLDTLRQREEARLDPATYRYVWEGAYLENSEKQVFRNWRVDELTPPGNVVWFYGADWGFANDETAAVRCCIIDGSTLYIDSEVYELGVPTEALPSLLNKLPDATKWPMRGDNARPETIDYIRRHGFPKLRSCKKGKGSVEDGVTFLQGMDIVIHPACVNTAREFRAYSYKTDPRTDEILPVVEDRNNHAIDALRYAVEGLHRKGQVVPSAILEQLDNGGADYGVNDENEEDVNWKTA